MDLGTSAYQPFPYQREAREAVRGKFRDKHKRTILNMATGTGKTITGAFIARPALEKGGRVLWLGHTDELITQPYKTLRKVMPRADVGIVKAGANAINAQVMVASVQTLRESRLRLLMQCQERFGRVTLIISDECHHDLAPQRQMILDTLDVHVVGLTATTERADGRSLHDVYPGGIAYSLPIDVAIQRGFLVPWRAKRVLFQGLELDKVKRSSRRGFDGARDFQAKSLQVAMTDAQAAKQAADAYVNEGEGRPAVIYLPGVDLAHQCAEHLKAAGIRAAFVAGDDGMRRHGLTKMHRKIIDRDMNLGNLDVVCNAMALTEGWDCPRVSCVVMARPTQSTSLYIQCLGRGLRLWSEGEKTDCIVIDCVGATAVHDTVQAPVLVGNTDAEPEKVAKPKMLPEGEGDGTGELFEKESSRNWIVEKMVKDDRWVQLAAGERDRSLRSPWAAESGIRSSIILEPHEVPGQDEPLWDVHFFRSPTEHETVARDLQEKEAKRHGEDVIRRQNTAAAIRARAKFREKAATTGQKHALQVWGVDAPYYMSAGTAADLLTQAICRTRLNSLQEGRGDPIWIGTRVAAVLNG